MTTMQLTIDVLNLAQQVVGIRDLLLQWSVEPPPLPAPSKAIATLSYTGMTETAVPAPPPSDIPIYPLSFPPSPSSIPTWPLSEPMYTMVPTHDLHSGAPRPDEHHRHLDGPLPAEHHLRGH